MNKTKFYYNDKEHPLPNKPNHIGITAVIIHNDNEVLLAKMTASNRWCLIGGGLNTDETLDECFSRVVLEKTALNLTAPKKYKVYDDPTRIVARDDDVVRMISVVYVAHLEDEENLLVHNEALDLAFFPYDEIQKLDVVETHKHIIDEIFDSSDIF